MNIFLVGKTSTGKSSFINAITEAIVANPGIKAETSKIDIYKFNDEENNPNNHLEQLSLSLHGRHKDNKNKIDISENIYNIPSNDYEHFKKSNIYDFPGINDKIFELIKDRIHQADLVIYFTNSYNPLSNKSDVKYFKLIEDIVQKKNNSGQFIELIIAINKYDDFYSNESHEQYNINDYVKKDISEPINELDEMYNNLKKTFKNKIFRISTHKMLIQNIIKNKKTIYVPLFLNREIKTIFKNCNITYNSIISISLAETRQLRYEDIISSNKLIKGDWDNICEYIYKMQRDLSVSKLDHMLSYANQMQIACRPENIEEYFNYIDLIKEKNNCNNKDFGKILIDQCNNSFKINETIDTKFIFNISENELKSEYVGLFKGSYLTHISLFVLVGLTTKYIDIDNEEFFKYLNDLIFKQNSTWNDLRFDKYMINDVKLFILLKLLKKLKLETELIIDLINEMNVFDYTRSNKVLYLEETEIPEQLSNILHNIYNKDFFEIIRLCTLPVLTLKMMRRNNMLDSQYIFSYCDDKMIDRLDILMLSNSIQDNEKIGGGLFNETIFLNKFPKLRYYYEQLKEIKELKRFKKCT